MSVSRFKQWWDANPDKASNIKADRRSRYAEDADFAEHERARKRAAYHQKKQHKEAELYKALPRPKLIWLEEQMVEMWSVGRVARYLGVHKRTIASMEARGAIPTNRFIDVNGRRWWPAKFVEWLKVFFDLRKSGKLSARDFTTRVLNEWENEQLGSIPRIRGANHGSKSIFKSVEGQGDYDQGDYD